MKEIQWRWFFLDEKLRIDTEECEWCNSTGDVERNRRIYWGTVALVAVLIILLYLLSRLFG
jgi:uncharacterized Rmd1/YagE family protein